jgi:putative flavoprotein involved in K+ transport
VAFTALGRLRPQHAELGDSAAGPPVPRVEPGRIRHPSLSGNDDGHNCHARWLGERGAVLAGRVDGSSGNNVRFASDLAENLAFADEFAGKFMARVDGHVTQRGLGAPAAEPPVQDGDAATVDRLDLAGTGAIVWATGYRSDFSWVDAPRDEDGSPLHSRGVSASRGLYFVGLPWLHKRKSPLLLGVGEDAGHVVAHLCER